MIPVTLDTNIWISAIFWVGEGDKIIKLILDNKLKVFISKDIIDEIRRVAIEEEKFKLKLDKDNLYIEEIINYILKLSNLIEVKSKVNVIEHLEDNQIMACAIDSRSKYLISYDNHLLKLKQFENIKILTPEEFLKLFLNKK